MKLSNGHLRQQELESQREVSYPWDDWERRALKAEIDNHAASLGRAVMREAYNHSWSPQLMHECGWSDGGASMLERLKRDPANTLKRWQYLLAVDGGHLSDREAAEIIGWDRLKALLS